MSTNGWDHSVDLLIVGSGAGAMTAAICAHDRGASTLLIEKTEEYGGSSAMSGGSLWIPNNHLMAGVGIDDSREDALTYLRHITEGEVPEEKLAAYVDTSPEMLRYMHDKARLNLLSMSRYADYYSEAPGGKPGGRSCEPHRFHASALDGEFETLRGLAPQELVMNRYAMTATEGHDLLTRTPGWFKLFMGIVMRYWIDFAGRVKSRRDRSLTLGNALVGQLRRSLMDRDIPVWLRSGAAELVVENGRVVGVVAERDGKRVRLEARKGVLFAAGGFESSDSMRKKYLPNPTEAAWTVANPGNMGDVIRMGMEHGAAVDLMDDAWWGPVTVVPGEARARMLVVEKGLPRSMFVNKRGERFLNEASPYNDICKAMYAADTPEAQAVPCYMIFDAGYRKKYPIGPLLPAAQQPDFAMPGHLKTSGYIKKAKTLDELAGQTGIDAAGLKASVEKINRYARDGKDPDFGRGEGAYQRYYGDETVEPNPCLGPIEKPPFYSIEVYPGDLGTKGGLRTDAGARVLKESGEPIAGLYAIGNCSASVMGGTYPGAGGTIGPAMTFGYIVARDLFAG